MQYNKKKRDKNQKRAESINSKYAPQGLKAIDEFKYGAFKLAKEMAESHGLYVPITPISFKGTKTFPMPLNNVIINIGRAQTITPHMQSPNPVSSFKEELEKTVVSLYMEK